jgi:two-component system, sensor histidine kinase and response regulator
LLAEDDDVNAIVTERALRRLGYDVVRAQDGHAAVEVARAAIEGVGPAIDLVVMDMRMPGMNGDDATRAIRRLEREAGKSRLPVIALSASLDVSHPLDDAEVGIDAFLAKPADVSKLAAAIERLEAPRKARAIVVREA